MKVLVTGGAGFIGSHIVDAYIKAGHEVVIVDNLSTGISENVNPKAKFFKMDIPSKEIHDLVEDEKVELINHQAAHISVSESVKDPEFDAKVNILGTINLLQAASRAKSVKKIIFASTGGAMYGNRTPPFVESMTPAPLSPYGISKRAVEMYLHFYKEERSIDYVALRYANVYGPRQNPHGEAGVVAIFCQGLISGKQPQIFGDGQQTRDFVYVLDVVKANMLATMADVIGEFNIGTSVETDVNQVYRVIAKELNSKVEAVHGDPRPGEQQTCSLDNKKAKESLGWEPKVKFEDGIKMTVDFFRNEMA